MEYRIATSADFDKLWNRNVAENPEEPMWPIWRERFRSRIAAGTAITFCAVLDGDPVGEGTLELATSKDPQLCDGKTTAYLSALRVRKEYEGQGHISRLVRLMEDHARLLGFSTLTIGVEEKEQRNCGIYAYWGYVNLVMEEIQDGEKVLYYAKYL